MADNKKYYYLKLKDNFFDSDEMIVLESMPDGHLYSNILLKLYLRSLRYHGKLMFNDRIPYNPTILAQVTRHNVGVVEKALDLFREFGLIEMLDNGAIYMTDIQNFIGTSSTEADRKREYRTRIESEKGLLTGQMSTKRPDKTTPEIEIELKKEREKDLEIDNNIVKSEIVTIPYELIVSKYNSILGCFLSKVMSISKSRKAKMKVRWNNDIKAIDGWEFLFNKVAQTPFLLGDNKQGWKCDFDWLIKNDSNFVKVLEGNYDKADGIQAQVNVLERWANE